ncbi:hypothetical protein TanjilG_11282 [Lupinus angustifolius]|uniref:RING-CH-type domain-containing protein n=1 Tax=Lupinus angustifolius TaxID=3871 RepID=A0A1J7H8H7_LUPAN|nr:hypothetical protein TanjilG_11282 [Lupinus angustifolius]
MGVAEETSHGNRQKNIVLEVPSRTTSLESGQDFVGIKMPMTPSPGPATKRVNFLATSRSVDAPNSNSAPGPSAPRGKPSIRNMLPKLTFRQRTSSDIEKANLTTATPDSYFSGIQEKSPIPRSVSMAKMFTPKIRRTSSLPVEEFGHANTEFAPGGCFDGSPYIRESQGTIARSNSVPVNSKEQSIRRMDSHFRIISTPQVKKGNEWLTSSTTQNTENGDADGEDIGAEEAVCRICMVELCEGGETFKMECSCKGELALAHQECAIKWFSIKGNKTCDVCKEEVQNLSVTLLRVQNAQPQSTGATPHRNELRHPSHVYCFLAQLNRVWQELPVLVLVSMLAYFCFLEELLVGKQAILSILLATFAGFGVVMSGSSIVAEIFKWRRTWQALTMQQNGSQGVTHSEGQYPQTINAASQTGPSNRTQIMV